MAAARSHPAKLAALLTLTALASAPPAKGQGALWCLPALAETAAKLAEACGRPLPPEARARVDRMSEASLAAVERVKGPEIAWTWRVEFRRMSALPPAAITPEHCAVQLSQLKGLLDLLSAADRGEEMVRQVEVEAETSKDPLGGPCL